MTQKNENPKIPATQQNAYFVPPTKEQSITKAQGKIVRIAVDPAFPDIAFALQNFDQKNTYYLVSDVQSLDLSVGINATVTGVIVRSAQDGIPILRVESIEIK